MEQAFGSGEQTTRFAGIARRSGRSRAGDDDAAGSGRPGPDPQETRRGNAHAHPPAEGHEQALGAYVRIDGRRSRFLGRLRSGRF